MAAQAKQKCVLFGGTFDPIHLGHIKTVVAACKQIQADELIFIPCHIPPHKQSPSVTSADRLNMVQLVADNLNAEVNFQVSCSDHELSRGGASYTSLTLSHFAKQKPQAQLYFFIGMDSYLNFTSWYNWQQILSHCQLLVAQRPGYQLTTEPDPLLQQHRQLVTIEQYDISSSQIRNDGSAQLKKTWLSKPVQNYIEKNNLYKT